MEQTNKSYRWWMMVVCGIAFFAVAGIFQHILFNEKSFFISVTSTICSGLGGFLLSIPFSSDKAFLRKLTPRIDSIIRQTALIASQISSIINSNKDENNIVIIQLSQILPHILAVTTDLEALAEKNFDPQVLINTKSLIGDLLTIMERRDFPSKDSPSVKQIVQQLTEIYSNIPVELLNETVCCPYCGAQNDIKIGANPPSSAMPICCKCGERFHANRQKNGEVLTRKKGAYSEKKKDPDNFSK